jgi:hypothetical protein
MQLLSIGIFVICVLIFLGYLYLDRKAAKEVGSIKKKPMLMCDEHGWFLKADALIFHTEDINGGAGLPVEICPFCWHERMKKAKEKLNKNGTDSSDGVVRAS